MSSTIDETEPVEKQEEHATEPIGTDYPSFTERVRRYVLEVSGSLAEVSRMTGIPKTTLGGWLSGKKDLTTGVFDKVCEAYCIYPITHMDTKSLIIPSIDSVSKAYESLAETAAMRRLSEEHKSEVDKLNGLVQWYQSKLRERAASIHQLLESSRDLQQIVRDQTDKVRDLKSKRSKPVNE